MNYDCVTVGNAVIDTFLTLQDSNSAIHLNKPERTLAVPYGQKILLESCEFMLGGNACNVSVGLTRAGFKTALVAEIATDEFSQKIINGLTKEQVVQDLILRHEGQSSFSIGLNFQGERTLFIEHQDREHDFHFESLSTKLIYLTSLGFKWKHVYDRVAHFIQSNPTTILAFNPGSRQFKDGIAGSHSLLPLTSLLFLNLEEAELLVGEKGTPKELLEKLKRKGSHTIILTDGEKGSHCIDEHGRIYQKDSIDCPVVERTGAGDAYATGFIAAFLKQLPIDTCMTWGTHNAAAVIGKTGAQAGLLREEELRIKQ